ncbi:formylglycine-generating enzyme family protein [Aequorivita sp. Q41]|uniref:formylglycine-generating enzyme family protein n=1 Tax=Aequorivita sp. Q41 TaxID=3153300 RepID=UPI003242AC3A
MFPKVFLVLFVSIISLTPIISQNALAKIEYAEAETAFQEGKYAASLEHLALVKEMLGSTNAKVMYLEILGRNKLLAELALASLKEKMQTVGDSPDTHKNRSDYLMLKKQVEAFEDKDQAGIIPSMEYLINLQELVGLTEVYIASFETTVPLEKLKAVYTISKEKKELAIGIDAILKVKELMKQDAKETALTIAKSVCESGGALGCTLLAHLDAAVTLKKNLKALVQSIKDEMILVAGPTPFYIAPYELSIEQWHAGFGKDYKNYYSSGGGTAPIKNVSIINIAEFIKALNTLTGLTYRLPTETEWDYAASGGAASKGYKYAGSDAIDEVAHYKKNTSSYGYRGTLKPNELGLYDMSGNVAELCSTEGNYTVLKGGSIFSSRSECELSREGEQLKNEISPQGMGVRLVLDASL